MKNRQKGRNTPAAAEPKPAAARAVAGRGAAPTQPAVPTQPAAPKWKGHALPIAGLWIATLLAYSNSFQSALVYDAASRIGQDTRIQAATSQNVSLIFHSDYWHPAIGSGLYRPVTTLSYLFNYAVLGNQDRPAGYHVVNWMLHSVNASLVYLLVWLLAGETLWAAAAAALWALHPALTESVTNLVGRADLLAGAGVLGGLACYVLWTRTQGPDRWNWLGAAVAAVSLGMFSKESAVVVLPMAALYDAAFGAPGAGRWRGRLAAYGVLALPCVIYLMARYSVYANSGALHIPFTDNPIAGAGFLAGKLTAIKVIGRQMLLLVWPAALSCDYSYNQIPLSSLSDWRAWTALAACLGAAGAAVIGYRRSRPVFFWIGFFFLALAPTANLARVIGTVMAERFLYLPAIAFAWCVVAAARRMPPMWSRAALAAIAIALAARTYARNFDWKDDASLWRSAVAASPQSYKTHLSQGSGKLQDALPEIERALAIVDGLPDELNAAQPYVTGGQRYRENGDYRRSLELLLRGERIQRAHYQWIRHQQELLKSNAFGVGWSPVYEELAKTYIRIGDFTGAVGALREALKLRATPELFEQLSVAYYKAGDRASAAVALLEGLSTDNRNQRLGNELISLYGELDPNGCEVQRSGAGKGLNLECPTVHEHACRAWRNVADRYVETGQAAAATQANRYAVESMACPPR